MAHRVGAFSALVPGICLLALGLPAEVGPAEAVADRSPPTTRSDMAVSRTAARNAEPVRLVRDEAALRSAWADPRRTRIDLGADIVLRDCHLGDPIRESPFPLVLDGHGYTLRQACFEKRVLRQDGTGWLDLRNLTLTRGGSDGPGAALTSRGEIMLRDCAIEQNLAEEPGGGVFSMRRVTVHRCSITGNLANDDGGGIYARRGGVQVYDSVLSTNLVDGSGGAIGSTGDILVVRSKVDGNTTDGDGGALYADEDGDVVVIGSLIDGSDADGPGGAIFTLDGDVAVFNSTLIGNRADDRGGAIAGEADVLVVNSTLARNLAVAHAGGGIWARGDLLLVNSTVTNNYAEGEGGGVLAAGRLTIVSSTLTRNIAPVGGDVGAAGVFHSFASIVGPPVTEGVTGDTIPTRRACRVYTGLSEGYNFGSDATCGLRDATDIVGDDPRLAQLEDDPNGFVLTPVPGSPVRARIPSGSCRAVLPSPVPAGQLLEDWIAWDHVLAHDAVGTPRDTGGGCDIGAVQSVDGAGPGRAAGDVASAGHVGPYQVAGPVVPDQAGSTGPTPRTATPPYPAERPRPAGGPSAALDRLSGRLRALAPDAERFETLLGCSRRVGVSQVGDVRHRWGYLYDERDGTGLDRRPALTADSTDPEWWLLRLATSRRCLSRAPDPNGAGDDARTADTQRSHSPSRLGPMLRRLHRLERRAQRIDHHSERFDAWESCLAWLPVTEAGDRDQDLGFLRSGDRGRAPAIDLDASEWDDPDYQLLAFRGQARPFAGGECGGDPGESADKGAPRPRRTDAPETWQDLRDGIRDLREDVADLAEPVGEITRFDECLYTVGVASRQGYRFRSASGAERVRSALSFDMRGPSLPTMSLMAFPGEEPPQIECNEDAGGVETDE